MEKTVFNDGACQIQWVKAFHTHSEHSHTTKLLHSMQTLL